MQKSGCLQSTKLRDETFPVSVANDKNLWKTYEVAPNIVKATLSLLPLTSPIYRGNNFHLSRGKVFFHVEKRRKQLNFSALPSVRVSIELLFSPGPFSRGEKRNIEML